MQDESTTPPKRCTGCGAVLPATTEHFHRSRHSPDGLRPRCKACAAQEAREQRKRRVWTDEAIEHRRAYQADYRQSHPGQRSAYQADYYTTHRVELLAYHDAYRAEHRGELAQKESAARRALPAQVLYAEWRATGCVVCGESEVWVMQAHHIDPARKEQRNLTTLRDAEAMAAELAKCVPLCANDHFRVHHALNNGHRGASLDEVIAYLKAQRAH